MRIRRSSLLYFLVDMPLFAYLDARIRTRIVTQCQISVVNGTSLLVEFLRFG
jgi:hypothetical protein